MEAFRGGLYSGPPQALTGVALEEPFPVEVSWVRKDVAKATGKTLEHDLQMVFHHVLSTSNCECVSEGLPNLWEEKSGHG